MPRPSTGGAEVRESAQPHILILTIITRGSLMQIKLGGESFATWVGSLPLQTDD
jgi:hypothetical protein